MAVFVCVEPFGGRLEPVATLDLLGTPIMCRLGHGRRCKALGALRQLENGGRKTEGGRRTAVGGEKGAGGAKGCGAVLVSCFSLHFLTLRSGLLYIFLKKISSVAWAGVRVRAGGLRGECGAGNVRKSGPGHL